MMMGKMMEAQAQKDGNSSNNLMKLLEMKTNQNCIWKSNTVQEEDLESILQRWRMSLIKMEN